MPLQELNDAIPTEQSIAEYRPHRARLVVGICLAMAAIQLLILKALPHSRSLVESVSVASLARENTVAPTPDFQIASLQWTVERYTREPSLEPFRRQFRSLCRGRDGLEAAVALSQTLTVCSFGQPLHEFSSTQYRPASALQRHLAGEPAECLARSGIVATGLLANGIPARIVQFVPPAGDRGGHTVVEVWSSESGWVLYDPSYEGTLTVNDKPASALEALRNPDLVRWRQIGRSHVPSGSGRDFYETEQFPLCAAQGGAIFYPEPWLYVRTGERASFWPFRGRYLRVGPASWKLGPGQRLLQSGILVCLLAGGLAGWIGRIRKSVETPKDRTP